MAFDLETDPSLRNEFAKHVVRFSKSRFTENKSNDFMVLCKDHSRIGELNISLRFILTII